MSLQIYLPFNGDTKNYGLANDVTIVTNNITFNQNGKIGQCAVFNGSNSFISLTSTILNNCFKGSNQEVTIAFWIKHSDTNRAIIFGDYGLTGAIGFNLELKASSTSDWRWYWNGSPDQSLGSNVAPADGNWHHCAIVYTGTKLRAYKDGVLTGSELTLTLSSKTKSSGAWYVGRDNRTGTTAFSGNLNDFRIYDNALSVSEIAYLAGNKKHKQLELWMPLNNNLNSYGTKKITATGTAITYTNAKTGKNATFNGSTSIIKTDYSWAPVTSWTIAGWAKRTTGAGCIVRSFASYSPTIDWDQSGNQVRCFMFSSTSTPSIFCTTNQVPPINEWHHYVGTWDGTTIKLYIDGVLKSSIAHSGPCYCSGDVCLGYSTGCGYLNGSLADVRLYNYALTPSEIYELSLARVGHYLLNGLANNTDYVAQTTKTECNACNGDRVHHKDNINVVYTTLKTAESPRYQNCYNFIPSGAKYINLGTAYSTLADQKTYLCWVYATNYANAFSSTGQCGLLSSVEGGGDGWISNGSGTSRKLRCYSYALGSCDIDCTTELTPGWHLLAHVQDGFKTTIYIDGVLLRSGTAKTSKTALSTKANNLYLCAECSGQNVNANYAKMKVSNLEIFGTALTADQILERYKKAHIIDISTPTHQGGSN